MSLEHVKNEMDGRYDRQLVLPDFGEQAQKALKNAHVLVIGAGGLGSPVLMYLAAAGVGHIGIVENDVLSMTNLNRQILHGEDMLGEGKATSAKKTIKRLNSQTEVTLYPCLLSPDKAEEIIKDYDFILDCVDNFPTKFLINDTCVLLKKPFCHAGVIGYSGQVLTCLPDEGPCMRCVFEEIPKDGTVPTAVTAGIMGAAAGIIGSIQALEAIKYLTGQGELLTGRMLIFDGLTMKVRQASFKKKNPACRVCGPKADIKSVKENKEEYKG